MALIGATVAETDDLSDEVLSEGEQQEAEAGNLHNDDTETAGEEEDQGEEEEHILVVDENTDLNEWRYRFVVSI